jgi:hypothetical protein
MSSRIPSHNRSAVHSFQNPLLETCSVSTHPDSRREMSPGREERSACLTRSDMAATRWMQRKTRVHFQATNFELLASPCVPASHGMVSF